ASFLLIVVTVATLQNRHLISTGLSARSDPIVMIENPPDTKVDSATLRAELERLPQARGVSEIAQPPWISLSGTLMATSPDKNAPTSLVMTQAAGFDFFTVFDIPLIAGRVYSRERGDEPRSVNSNSAPETKSSTPHPIVVDRGLVEELGFASPEAAVGQLI